MLLLMVNQSQYQLGPAHCSPNFVDRGQRIVIEPNCYRPVASVIIVIDSALVYLWEYDLLNAMLQESEQEPWLLIAAWTWHGPV